MYVVYSAEQALPIFLDNLVPSWAAILTSVTLVVLFGQVTCSKTFTTFFICIGCARRDLNVTTYAAAEALQQHQNKHSDSVSTVHK
jgi:hypothetical protein